jgi:hypothetical protein
MKKLHTPLVALVAVAAILGVAGPVVGANLNEIAVRNWDWYRDMQLTFPSDDVRRAQQALITEGYDPGSLGGRLDEQTQDALRKYQKDHDLLTTGDLDVRTKAALIGDAHPHRVRTSLILER